VSLLDAQPLAVSASAHAATAACHVLFECVFHFMVGVS
jgi:hypothetical protein